MRPLRLTMCAFGPYAGTEVVNFDALTDLGLFVVAGNNGSGKTTIFDALHYSLYGTLPGRRASYAQLRSDHADPGIECSVVFEFAAHGKQWRVERSPKQSRPKRRGDGVTQVEARATLYRLDQGIDGQPTAITNKINEVRDQCRELVGLSGKQFERVVLLPQGEFSRVLQEGSTERRKLLRALFSSELFGDATDLLSEAANAATAADQSHVERLDHQRDLIAAELSSVTTPSPQAGGPLAVPAPPHAVALPQTEQQLLELAERFRSTQLADLAQSVARDHDDATRAVAAHQHGVAVAERIERREQVGKQFAAHQAADSQHKRDAERLRLARSAVPVASQARAVTEQARRQDDSATGVTTLLQQANAALGAAGLAALVATDKEHFATAHASLIRVFEQLTQRHDAALVLADLDAVAKRLQGDVRRRANELAALEEKMLVAQSQRRQAANELEQLQDVGDIDACERELRASSAQLEQRRQLDRFDDEHDALTQQCAEQQHEIERLESAQSEAQAAVASHAKFQLRAAEALTDLEECTRRHRAVTIFAETSARLLQLRTDYERVSRSADEHWDAYIAGTAARVAEALTDDEPCPVCGSPEHPAPAEPPTSGHIVTEAEVARQREVAEETRVELQQTQSEVEALHATDPDIATVSIVELAAEISTAKAMALGARSLAEEVHATASRDEHLAAELVSHRTGLAELTTKFRSLGERRSQLRGALGEVANEPVSHVCARAERSAEMRAQAEQGATTRDALTKDLANYDLTIETIGLEQIAAENRRSSANDQLCDRIAARDQAASRLAELDDKLAETPESDTANTVVSGDATDYERRTQAARRAQELLGPLATAVALHQDAIDGLRRAESILGERLHQSPFATVEAAQSAYLAPDVIDQLEAHITAHIANGDRIKGQLGELNDLPSTKPDVDALQAIAHEANAAFAAKNRELITTTNQLDRCTTELASIALARAERESNDIAVRRVERVAALVKGDNDRNTSLENWVLAAHLRDVVELANLRLSRSTYQRFALCVLDDGQNRRGTWGLDLGVEDTVTGTRRPTAGLSGGELFQASLALALGLADAVMNHSAGVHIDALFIDEGFGSLDDMSVERAIDLLDELRDRGGMVGVITHVPALLEALPIGISVVDAPGGRGSTIRQQRIAA